MSFLSFFFLLFLEVWFLSSIPWWSSAENQLASWHSTCFVLFLSRLMTKPRKWPLRPAKTQISLGIRPVWSVFAVRMKEHWILSYPLSALRHETDQTGCMSRLIWVFAVRKDHFIGFVMRRLSLDAVFSVCVPFPLDALGRTWDTIEGSQLQQFVFFVCFFFYYYQIL